MKTEGKLPSAYAQYLTEVNRLMLEKGGVKYTEVAASIHPEWQALMDACDRGVAKDEFVARTMNDFGFIGTANNTQARAHDYNTRKAALCEYAASGSGWTRGVDGTLFRETEDGVAVMRPEIGDDGRSSFVIEIREGASVDTYMTKLSKDGTVVGKYVGADIDQAMAGFEATRHYEGPRMSI